MKVQCWCENWLIRWFSNYVRITNLWGFLKLSFRRYSYLGQNNCLCLRSRVVAWSCFDEQIRRKSWFTLWWFVVVLYYCHSHIITIHVLPPFRRLMIISSFYGLNAKVTSLFIISAVPVLTIKTKPTVLQLHFKPTIWLQSFHFYWLQQQSDWKLTPRLRDSNSYLSVNEIRLV